MTFSSGTKLGTYEIVSLLGAGGMGEVYRARDSKLKREVAIKVLPDAFSRDTERVARFQREAEVLASLNHPNIAQIYGLEGMGASRCIVMELVEGETVQERLKRGPIPLDEALPIAKQIAEALEAAHHKGIIHRDLKPANVKITSDRKVKVLDFGLAKAMENTPANPTLSNSPTLSLAATNAGMILGTAAYMSPEQTKGREVDRRTDIFAFGALLYEMLTARPAFDGEDVQDILGAVLKSEPDWTRLPAGVPPSIQKLLRLCLQKDAKKRRQTATDVWIDLEDALADPGASTPVATPTRSVRLAWMVSLTVAVVLAGVMAVPALRHLRETPPPDIPETRLEITTPATTNPVSFALSPDGRQIVFVASGDGPPRLWLRPLDKVAAQPLAGTDGASYPFWSPDSRSVAFFADNKLKRVDVSGGLPQTLANAAGGRGGTWSLEGVILFANNVGPVFRIPASGGEAVALTKVDAPRQNNHRFPQWLPGGRQYLFYAPGQPDAQGIYLGSLDAPETKRLTAADTAGLYAPPGWLLFQRQGTLIAQRFDLSVGELTGDPVTVAEPVGFDSNFAGPFSVSAAGLVAYRGGAGGRQQLTWFDRSGKVLGTLGAPDEMALSNPRLSPDGQRVAVVRTVQNNQDIWIMDGTRTSRFTFDAAFDSFPIWSPDGSRIVFDSTRKRLRNLFTKASSGASIEEPLLESPQDKGTNDWSADGRFLLYQSLDPQDSFDLWALPLEGDRKPWVFLKTNFQERNARFSPDVRWVAYASNESGREEIYVRPFVEPAIGANRASAGAGPGDVSHRDVENRATGQWQVSTSGGSYPRWRPDGKELYYIGPDGQMMAVPVTATAAALELGTPVELFEMQIYLGRPGWQYDVTRDGRFLINTVLDNTATSSITLIQNWKPKP